TVVGRSHLYDLCWLLALPCPDTPDREPLGMTPVWRWKAHVLKLPARQRGLACLFLPADAAIERAREPRFALGRRCGRFPVEPDHVVVSHAFPFRTSWTASSAATGSPARAAAPPSRCWTGKPRRTARCRRSPKRSRQQR